MVNVFQVKDSSKPCKMSNYERRFPTHIEDVAHALKLLVTKRLQVCANLFEL